MQTYSADPLVLDEADLAVCRALLRGGSRSFHAASLLLPRRISESAAALYAFCRVADDAIDQGEDRAAALAALRARLERAYAGQPEPHPVDRAFAAVVRRHDIPRAIPDALLEGFEWDAAGRRYRSITELEAYAARVAGTVGVMMTLLMDQRTPAVLARACDLGVAMQLTNIARDVGEDARAGRLYLPLDWLQDAGIDPDAWLARPEFNDALAVVVRRLLDAADALYERATGGIGWLPGVCRPGMYAARLLYAEIGRALARDGLDSVSRRAQVPAARKAQLLGRALLASTRPRAPLSAAILDEVRFLVEAAAASEASLRDATPTRVEWLIDLFERLERQQLAAQGRS